MGQCSENLNDDEDNQLICYCFGYTRLKLEKWMCVIVLLVAI